MTELLAVIEDPAFSWYPKWIKLDESGQPKNWIKDGMNQPLTIKIQWSTHNGCKMLCNVSPDKGFFRPEYALTYTISDFETKLLVHWEKVHS